MRNFFRLPRKSPGESLAETVIAITILSIILVSIFQLLARAIKVNENSELRTIALNVAREGIEGVRNIRDTNWLRYSGDRRNKWLCLGTDCSSKILENTYKLSYTPPYYTLTVGNSEPLHADYKIGTSDFYRQLKLKPESDDVCNTALNPCTENRLNVISRIQWKENDATREVVLETYLYDFYGRNSY